MSRQSNNVLVTINHVETILDILQGSTRSQLDLIKIDEMYEFVLSIMKTLRTNNCDVGLLTEMGSVYTICKEVRENPETIYVTNELKRRLYEHMLNVQHLAYLFVGQHYTTNKFSYYSHQHALIVKIIDYCVDHGYYFGLDTDKNGED